MDKIRNDIERINPGVTRELSAPVDMRVMTQFEHMRKQVDKDRGMDSGNIAFDDMYQCEGNERACNGQL